MRAFRFTCLFIAFLMPLQVAAQEAQTAVDKVNTPTEKATKPPERRDAFDDFEKQLQKELEGVPGRTASEMEQPSVILQFVRTLLTLAFLLAIFYGIFRLYKFKRELPTPNLSAINSIYEYPLGQNQKLQIIELAGRLMILGVSESSVQLIAEITDKYTIDRIKLDCAEDNKKPRPDFLTELSRAIKTNLRERFGKRTEESFAKVPPGAEDLEAQRQSSLERLRRLKAEKFDWRDKA